jgi:hypothetical protein
MRMQNLVWQMLARDLLPMRILYALIVSGMTTDSVSYVTNMSMWIYTGIIKQRLCDVNELSSASDIGKRYQQNASHMRVPWS